MSTYLGVSNQNIMHYRGTPVRIFDIDRQFLIVCSENDITKTENETIYMLDKLLAILLQIQGTHNNECIQSDKLCNFLLNPVTFLRSMQNFTVPI